MSPAIKNAPQGVEVVKKVASDGSEFYFVMNFAGKEETVEFPCAVKDITTDEVLGNKVTLAVYGSAAVARA